MDLPGTLEVLATMGPEELNIVLQALHQRLSSGLQQSSSIDFKLQRKVNHADGLVERLQSFTGPDKETRSILATNFDRWTHNTQGFWNTLDEHTNIGLSAEAQVVQTYIRARGDDA
ncbi:hypothetical protein LTR86_011020 [Recurvomyces mirabilis]|nr:hypothetical protein LTR86_011020 [Recurvomyces mirabilis]